MNQCDGCRAGWELRDGLHYDRHGTVQMTCTATRYPLSANAIKTLPNGDTEAFSLHITSMVPEQPEALRLADEMLDGMNDEHWNQLNADAAAELRRLHTENEALREALKEIADDYADRFDLDDPSTNPGIKYTIKQARAALARAGEVK